jgi:hypothetical protein
VCFVLIQVECGVLGDRNNHRDYSLLFLAQPQKPAQSLIVSPGHRLVFIKVAAHSLGLGAAQVAASLPQPAQLASTGHLETLGCTFVCF